MWSTHILHDTTASYKRIHFTQQDLVSFKPKSEKLWEKELLRQLTLILTLSSLCWRHPLFSPHQFCSPGPPPPSSSPGSPSPRTPCTGAVPCCAARSATLPTWRTAGSTTAKRWRAASAASRRAATSSSPPSTGSWTPATLCAWPGTRPRARSSAPPTPPSTSSVSCPSCREVCQVTEFHCGAELVRPVSGSEVKGAMERWEGWRNKGGGVRWQVLWARGMFPPCCLTLCGFPFSPVSTKGNRIRFPPSVFLAAYISLSKRQRKRCFERVSFPTYSQKAFCPKLGEQCNLTFMLGSYLGLAWR